MPINPTVLKTLSYTINRHGSLWERTEGIITTYSCSICIVVRYTLDCSAGSLLPEDFSPWVSGLKTGSSPETQQTVTALYWSNCSQRPVHSSLIAFDFADWAVSLLPAHIFCSQGYHTMWTTSTVPTGSGPLGCYSDLACYYDCCIHLAPGSWAKPPGLYYFSFPITPLLLMSLTLWLPLLLSTWACTWTS